MTTEKQDPHQPIHHPLRPPPHKEPSEPNPPQKPEEEEPEPQEDA